MKPWRRGSGRPYQLVCLLLIVVLMWGAIAPAHQKLQSARGRLLPTNPNIGGAEDLDSFAMGLLLGGFRGPLVLYLWMTSEDEKNQEQTEKLLTRCELIGNLQPQFVPIYSHQSWNLAYNISVQYSRPNERYRWIQEGIAFAEKGDRRIPRNTDILSQLGQLYYDKLGSSYESAYYRERFREDSLRQMLTKQGVLTDEYAKKWVFLDGLERTLIQLRSAAAQGQPRIDRLPPPSEGPRRLWPDGVSVFAVAYDYYKQAAQPGLPRHSQFGPTILSSRPAIACRAWADEELNLALAAEKRLWSATPAAGGEWPLPSAAVLAAEPARALLAQALEHDRQAVEIALLARAEYASHLERFPQDTNVFATHMHDMTAKSAMAQAAQKRLAAIALLTGEGAADQRADARNRLLQARVDYLKAIRGIHDYLATEFRAKSPQEEIDPSDPRRVLYEALLENAKQAVDQITRILQSGD